MVELFDFQEAAAARIAENVGVYLDSPATVTIDRKPHVLPCFQALSSITGSGKTVILASTVARIARTMPVAPVVLWLSKGKVVVSQTFENLSAGGKYNHVLETAKVTTLADYSPQLSADTPETLLLLATVGTFNQKDKETGTLQVHRSDVDTIGTSVWNALKLRLDSERRRRPLIIVYDEAQNLSDQQAELLSELQPEVFLAASATLRWPSEIANDIQKLKDSGFDDDFLITRIDTKRVLEAGLIKETVILEGYNSPMEEAVAQMISSMKEVTQTAIESDLDFKPKSIYVCNTNTSAFDASLMDDPKTPFQERTAAPILIWRYLVDGLGVDPEEIAVYAQLKTSKEAPLPEEFQLFRGGDKDYADFTAGDYKHIIFNQSLQEGWDDPAVYFAYIDKSMGSPIQVTQVIGRVLRQPGATRYPSESLNAARFYVRVDTNSVFNDIIEQVSTDLGDSDGDVRLVITPPGTTPPKAQNPKEPKEIPYTGVSAKGANGPAQELVNRFPDFTNDSINTQGAGSRRVLFQQVGSESEDTTWEEIKMSSQATARWIVRQEIRKRIKRAQGAVDFADPKFNAMVGIGSPAYHQLINLARDITDTYIDHVHLNQRQSNPYKVGDTFVRPDKATSFKNSLHPEYSDLNKLELAFAQELDKTGKTWVRNSPRTGYAIPLISIGQTQDFYPDFIVWHDSTITCIDTKGEHLIAETAARKLLNIKKPEAADVKVQITFVSKGHIDKELQHVGKDGYTLWGLKVDGRISAIHYETLKDLLDTAIQ